MDTLSKSTKLGVIILALQLLGELKFRGLRLVKAVAKALGLSRKTGYLEAQRIEALLLNPPPSSSVDAVELLKLRISNRALEYQRDHRLRFDKAKKHLPKIAKEFCLQLFRQYKDRLTEKELAAAIGVPLANLRRWDEKADATGKLPDEPEHRGAHNRATTEDEDRVIQLYQNLEKAVSLEEFTQMFQEKYPEFPLSRRTITRILQGKRLREIITRSDSGDYHGRFKVYFPGAQLAIDGTESKVLFTSEPERGYKVEMETAIDIASGAVLGQVQGKEETGDGVVRVIFQANQECAKVLAVLSDNGSANCSGGVRMTIEQVSDVGQIFSFRYHPQTNGHLEGFHGQFARIVGKIEIDDRTREALAQSIVAVIWRIFIHFHNHSPRKRLGGMSPLDYLRSYVPVPEEVEQAREGLKQQKDRSEALKRGHPRLHDAGFRAIVERIVTNLGLKAPVEDALKALCSFDLGIIESAERAFYAYSERDGFDEMKRTFAYFMGIVRRKQKEIDGDRERECLTRQRIDQARREADVKKREEEKLRQNPEDVILSNAKLALMTKFVISPGIFLKKMREGLSALKKIGRCSNAMIASLAEKIRGLAEYGDDLRERLVDFLLEEYHKISRSHD